jgi:predicted pyridoxine 5'-phosphate oxidase superfamily flavin-nucleotide-binding protein
MKDIYNEQHRAYQQTFDTLGLADRLQEMIVVSEIGDDHRGFIESRDMFFLSTVDHRGFPTCSYKGGHPGFVKILDNRTLAFPTYDGNGMYLSLGNISCSSKIGMLFIDFEKPHRVRVHGTATVNDADPLLESLHGAQRIVRVAIAEIFVNCGRYIHKHQRLESSKYVPQVGRAAPFPHWKRINGIQDSLSARDRATTEALGGAITPEEYGALVAKGES